MALTEYVIMPGADYQAICDKVREKTGGEELLKSGDIPSALDNVSSEKILYMDAALLDAGGAYPADADDYTTAVIPADATFVSMESFDNLPNIDTLIINGNCEIEIESYYDSAKILQTASPFVSAGLPLKKVVIKDRTSIPDYVLDGCGTAATIEIENCGGIGNRSFLGSKIRALDLKNVTGSIGESAFHSCSNLVGVVIPEGVTSILGWAFYLCSNLATITIPTSVTNIANASSIPTTTVIRGYAGSYAESWASTNSRTFEVITE